MYRTWVILVQQLLLNPRDKRICEVYEKMMIVGQISSPEEAKEIEFIVKSLVIGNRMRIIASKNK